MANSKFEVGQRVRIVDTEYYLLGKNEDAGVVVSVNYGGTGDIEVAIDGYTTEEPFAGGWDTLAFTPSSLVLEGRT